MSVLQLYLMFPSSCSVCVTGAGGSIGSELCRQILRLSPSHLMLLERSEPALYTIEQYLRPLLPDGVTLTPVLGSATELPLMERIFTDHSVDLVFHAAAYKHVPLVESNVLLVLQTMLDQLMLFVVLPHAGVRKVILISTDKAVRPTNVWELPSACLNLLFRLGQQNLARHVSQWFVLGMFLLLQTSCPLFRSQIANGGPLLCILILSVIS